MTENDARARLAARERNVSPGAGEMHVASMPNMKRADEDSLSWFAFGVVLPIPGLLVWFANKADFPTKCARLIKGCVWGLILALVMSGVLFAASSAIGGAVSKLATSAATAIATASPDRVPMLNMYTNGVDAYDGPASSIVQDDGTVVPIDEYAMDSPSSEPFTMDVEPDATPISEGE